MADPTARFTEALDLAFDGSAIFGGNRSKRYALVIEDGKVKSAHVEPDNTGVNGKSPRPTRGTLELWLRHHRIDRREGAWVNFLMA